MKKTEVYQLIYGIVLFIIVFVLALLTTNCAPKQGDVGARGLTGVSGSNGKDGQPGSSCSVVSETYGALIVCSDGTSVQIHNGTDIKNCSVKDKDKDKNDR